MMTEPERVDLAAYLSGTFRKNDKNAREREEKPVSELGNWVIFICATICWMTPLTILFYQLFLALSLF